MPNDIPILPNEIQQPFLNNEKTIDIYISFDEDMGCWLGDLFVHAPSLDEALFDATYLETIEFESFEEAFRDLSDYILDERYKAKYQAQLTALKSKLQIS